MNYIKSWKIFESYLSDDMINIKSDIKDILLPFSDAGLYTSVNTISRRSSFVGAKKFFIYGTFDINIYTVREKGFNINEYKDEIIRLVEYMYDLDYTIKYLNIRYGVDKSSLFNINDIWSITDPVSLIEIEFMKKEDVIDPSYITRFNSKP
jgi:hypothetical protein